MMHQAHSDNPEQQKINDLATAMYEAAIEFGASELPGKFYVSALCLLIAAQVHNACGKDANKQDERIEIYANHIKTTLTYNGMRQTQKEGEK